MKILKKIIDAIYEIITILIPKKQFRAAPKCITPYYMSSVKILEDKQAMGLIALDITK